jgi:hypothetical protein
MNEHEHEMEDRRPLKTADLADATVDEVREQDTLREEVRDEHMRRDEAMPLFERDRIEEFHSRWSDIQADFVDEPRSAVERADNLVAEVMKSVADTFATEQSRLEEQWKRGDEVSTEDLRVALQRYRSFFNRLLSL